MADPAAAGVRAWMVKAWRDLETARRVAAGQPPFYDIAVYHCQQAAEKAVKAFLIHHGKPCEKTYDIEVLVDRASEIEPGFGALADAADANRLVRQSPAWMRAKAKQFPDTSPLTALLRHGLLKKIYLAVMGRSH